MKKQFNKIDLPQELPQIFPIKVSFINEKQIYDFSKEFDNKFSRLIAKIFYERHVNLSLGSRKSSYGNLCKFLSYLKNNNILEINEFKNHHMVGFAVFLDNQNLSLSSKYSLYHSLEKTIKYAKKMSKPYFVDIKIPTNPFTNLKSERPIPKKLNESQLKEILNICYSQIDKYFNTFKESQAIINKVEKDFADGKIFERKNKDHILHYFYKKYSYSPFATDLISLEKYYIYDIGGISYLNNAITPNIDILLPFYLALMFELAANSDALRQIKIDCIKEDPLFEDRCFIVWDKNRASSQQKRNVFKKKKYGAYQLIEMIKEITQHTRKNIEEKYKNSLFVVRGEFGRKKFLLAEEHSFNRAVKLFCQQNNLNYIFSPSDIRPSVLTEMYKNRKDIIGISKIANHKSINTTLLYVVDEETKNENRKYLSEKQNLIFENFSKEKITILDIKNTVTENAVNVGFICKNPIVDKNTCVNWMAELTNPNLIIPEKPEYLSRIIALQESILKAKNIMNEDRFFILYAPILDTINTEILIKFSIQTINEARELAKNIKLPSLEEY